MYFWFVVFIFGGLAPVLSSGGESNAGSPIGRQLSQHAGNVLDVDGLEIPQRQADRTAIEAAQVHGSFGRLRLTELSYQRPERIPKPVQVTRSCRIAGFQRPIGSKNELRQRAAVGRADAVKAAHHRTEESEVRGAEQADTSADPVGDLIDRRRRQVTLLHADDAGNGRKLLE